VRAGHASPPAPPGHQPVSGPMRIVTTPRAVEHIREHGGEVWVWLDPHMGPVGGYIGLESHCEPPRSSRRTKFTRASRRPHRFRQVQAAGITVHYDFGRMEPPEELHFDRKGWRKGTRRIEAYWNGTVFVGDDVPPPGR
jgi:hypothetical protein